MAVNEVTVLHIVAMPVIFLFGIAGAIMALYCQNKPRWFSLANSFSAGVFVAAALTDLLQDATNNMDSLADSMGGYNLAYVIAGIGFLLIFVIEEGAMAMARAHMARDTKINLVEIQDAVTGPQEVADHERPSGEVATIKASTPHDIETPVPHERSSVGFVDAATPSQEDVSESAGKRANRSATNAASWRGSSQAAKESISHPVLKQNKSSHGGSQALLHKESEIHGADGHDEGDHDDHFQISEDTPLIVSVTFLLALCAHSIISGLAIGAEDYNDFGTFIAVISHKTLAAFALAASLMRSKVSKFQYWLFMMIFCCSTPFGILVGILADVPAGPALGSIDALAAGSFLYVAVIELMVFEFAHHKLDQRGAKVVLMLLGYAFMAVLCVWA